MDVREKLVELLRNAKAAMKAENLSCDIARNMFVVDFMMANGVTVQEWISVNDRLPEDGESVLTYKNGNVDVQVYEKNRNGWIQGNWFWSMATVTHWMPLPEPPKRRMIMSIKCIMNGLEVNYPCSPSCALFGDCVTAFESQKKSKVRTNADRIRSMGDEELAAKISHQCISPLCDIVCGGGCEAVATLNKTSQQRCVEIVLDWLKQPAEGQ